MLCYSTAAAAAAAYCVFVHLITAKYSLTNTCNQVILIVE